MPLAGVEDGLRGAWQHERQPALGFAAAGPLDPECTAEKAAKSAAMKATAGVGGRCSPKEAAADTAKRTTGIDQDRKDRDDKGRLSRDKDGK